MTNLNALVSWEVTFSTLLIPESGSEVNNPCTFKIIFYFGKVYHNLKKAKSDKQWESDIAIARIQQIGRILIFIYEIEIFSYSRII